MAAPMEPVPLTIPETVAMADFEGTLQARFAETVDMIRENGPLISSPVVN